VTRTRTASLATDGWLTALTALAVVIAAGAVAGCSAPAPFRSPPRHVLQASRPAHTVQLNRSARPVTGLDLVSGAATVTVGIGGLGSPLVRVSTPANSSIRPDIVLSQGTAQVYLDQTGLGGPAAVSILLSASVSWRLQFAGGASQVTADLSGGHVSGIDFSAGTSLVTLALPRPHGTVTVTLAGGESQAGLSLPDGVPARLTLTGGASMATIGGRTYTGLGGGTVLTAPGYASATASRYDIQAPAGVSQITVSG
jgi:hypothetical protein